MLAIQVGLLLVLLAACSFLPGFYFVRRLRWTPLEKLAGSVALSLILLYLAAWLAYLFLPDYLSVVSPFVSLACVALGVVARHDLERWMATFRIRQALSSQGFLILWSLLILSAIRVYSGGNWFADWLEHFQRTLFFLHHFPAQTVIMEGYQLPARPPMMNVLAAFFLAQSSDRFELFQVIFTFLNALIYLPCSLLVPALLKRKRKVFWPLVALMALSPVFVQESTFSWTKSLVAFCVLCSLGFYLAGWRKQDRSRIVFAFVAMAAGILVHYSAGPYAVFLALHYLFFVFWKRQGKWQELALITTLSALLLATWFGWSWKTYGAHATLT